MIHRLRTTMALAATAGAVAAPTASAMLPPSDPAPAPPAGAPHAPAVNASASSGFDYGDAAIGAGAVIAVLLVGGGTIAVSRGRVARVAP
jgi:hypothetical protein